MLGTIEDIKGEDCDLFVNNDDCPEACLVIGVELGGLYFYNSCRFILWK